MLHPMWSYFGKKGPVVLKVKWTNQVPGQSTEASALEQRNSKYKSFSGYPQIFNPDLELKFFHQKLTIRIPFRFWTTTSGPN